MYMYLAVPKFLDHQGTVHIGFGCVVISVLDCTTVEPLSFLFMASKFFSLFLVPRVPYSRKYWWELNLVVGPQIAIAKILADLNLVVRYRITIRIYASMKY